ncbi:helix-turn-helix transcriptional regulator [Ferrovum sp.]|uniref:helix-turn-helix domain-containing protein n=1 Tax=Ferrovum sp. TaxID=2609467 RepID=UPI00260873CC|nr:helix-turn-helix transcriptional regulator [Ferrovum sp.]
MKKFATRTTAKAKTVAEYVSSQISLCGKMQREIAEEAGFENPNVITMIKQGRTKIPLEKVGKLAKALSIDPIFLFKMTLAEYQPVTMEAINSMFDQEPLTENELEIIRIVRSAGVNNPKVRSDEDRDRLLEVINSLKGDNETRE